MTFSCTAIGIPLPSVAWYSSRGLFLHNNNTLVIANVSRNDQEDFRCEAKNDAGKKTGRARLVVAGINNKGSFISCMKRYTRNWTFRSKALR